MTDAPLYFDDLTVGQSWSSEPIEMTQDGIIAFARQYDPQPMHTDPAAAEDGPFHGLAASGWQVACLAMRKFVEAKPFGSSAIVGMGVDDMRWTKPVRPGDRLTMRGEIIELRRSQSKPDRGVVRLKIEAVRQDGDVVMRFFTSTLLPAGPLRG